MARSLFSNSLARWAQAIIVHYATNGGPESNYYQKHGWQAEYSGIDSKIIIFPDERAEEEAPPDAVAVNLDQSPTCIANLKGPLIVDNRALTLILAGISKDLRLAQEKEFRATRKVAKFGKALAKK